MRFHLLKLAWLCALVCWLAALAALRGSGWPLLALLPLGGAGLGALAFLMVRVTAFHRDLARGVEELLAGNYDADLPLSAWLDDETTLLRKQINKMLEQLRAYDALRAGRVDLLARALNAVLRNVPRGVIIGDLDKYVFRFNPAVLKFFGVEQDTSSFEALENLPANRAFMGLFKWIVRAEKVPVEREVTLQISPYSPQKTFLARIVPLKDRTETVVMVLVFILDEDSG